MRSDKPFTLILSLLFLLLSGTAHGQEASSGSLFEGMWLSGQVNVITQGHPTFTAPYNGPNSLSSGAETATSHVLTLFSGFRVTDTTAVLFDAEAAGGRGIGDALGVAGFPNLDVVRNPTLSQAPYVARLMVHQTLPLSTETVEVERGPLQLAGAVPARRLDFMFGKLSTVDWFDVNAVGGDSHLQFMNWAVDNEGAYDYAADTRGYTYGLVVEYNDRNWSARFGEMLMPKVANGIDLDPNIARAHAENYEVEGRPQIVPKRLTVVRLLAFLNHANMGNYREAINAYRSGQDVVPDITAHRQQGRTKFGVGGNIEQEITSDLRAYARLGWNDGRNESFAYTEIDDSVSGGADLRGTMWHRHDDKLGVAVVSSGLSADHREYLRLGGLGFILGDGNLNYGRETILESYYTVKLWDGLNASFDIQRVQNPGFNRDRGPVIVSAVRVHFEGVLLRSQP